MKRIQEIQLQVQGSLLKALLPKDSFLNIRKGSIAALSPKLNVRLSTAESISEAVKRFRQGSPLAFQKVYSTVDSVEAVYLTPLKKNSSILVLEMNGISDYVIRSENILATGPTVYPINRIFGLGLGIHGLYNVHVTGKGPLVIEAENGCWTMDLEQNERMLVDPRYLLAWDVSVQLEQTRIPESRLAQLFSRLRSMISGTRKALPTTSKASLASSSTSTSSEPSLKLVASLGIQKLRDTLLGQQTMYTLKGPGRVVLYNSAPGLINRMQRFENKT